MHTAMRLAADMPPNPMKTATNTINVIGIVTIKILFTIELDFSLFPLQSIKNRKAAD